MDPWQQQILTDALGERADGRWAAFEVGEVIPRQNGKGSVLEARELAGAILFGERLIIHSAHEQATSSEHFRRMLQLLEEAEFTSRMKRPVYGKGSEAIPFKDGTRIMFKTRTGGGGRGLTGDLVVLDEAMMLPEAVSAALVPTMAARSIDGNPQLWYAGSAVDQQKHEHGVVLARLRARAFKRAPRIAYFEYSAPGGDPDALTEAERGDPRLWAMANPGMGIRISSEHISNECGGALGPREFAVERLGVGDWPATDGSASQVIKTPVWEALEDQDSEAEGRVAFSFDVSPDRAWSSISVSGRRADGLFHVEVVEHRPGTKWLPARLAEIAGKWSHVAIVADDKGPAGSLIPDLQQLNVKVHTVTASEYAQACGTFFDECENGTLRHLGTPEMHAAIRGAVKRPLGDAWAWSRKTSTVDISPLVACTLALWKLSSTKKSRPKFEVLA